MPKVGDKISFLPSAFACAQQPSKALEGMPQRVRATVTYINEEHRWFCATFEVWGKPMRECFKF